MRTISTVVLLGLCVSVTWVPAAAEVPATGQVIKKAQFLASEPIRPLNSQPTTTLTSSILAEPETGCQAGCSSPVSCCSTGCDDCCAGSKCRGCCQTCGCGPCCCGCNMYQHHAYFPPLHGYYYFRPYHHLHVRQQQMLVQSWGGNPADPYTNEIFQAVYKQYRTETQSNLLPGN